METGFRRGIEIEVLLTPRDSTESFSDLEEFANFLVADCNAKFPPGIRIHSDIDGLYEGPSGSREWSVTDDVTIRRDRDAQWPIEIVAPILQYHPGSTWREEVRQLFRVVGKRYIIEANNSCGLHVHVSPPEDRQWSLDTLKSLCRSIFFFEGSIELLLPTSRCGNPYARNNRRENSRLQNRKMQKCFELVDQCNDQVEIADIMNDGGNRRFAWNFTNLYYGGKSTVEFRQAPQTVSDRTCLPWVEFVVAFVHAARETRGISNLLRFTRDVHGLRRFLARRHPPGFNRGILDILFRGLFWYRVPRPLPNLTTEQQHILERKEEEAGKKNLVMKKLADLLSG